MFFKVGGKALDIGLGIGQFFCCRSLSDQVAAAQYQADLLQTQSTANPSSQENAAVGFHYEEAKARAPQALLLGVCPEKRQVSLLTF